MNRNKLHHRSLALLGSTLMSFGLLSTISPTKLGNTLSGAQGLSAWQELFQGEQAEARKSGGRVRGGSFGKKSSPPKSSSSPSKPSTSKPGKSTTTTTTTTTRSGSSYGGGYYGGGGWYYRSGGYYYIGGHPLSGGALAFWLTLFILFPFLGVLWWWRGWNASPYDNVYHDETTTTTTTTTTHYDEEDNDHYGTGNPELDNDIVNVSRLQLVMLSEARSIQSDLNTLGQQIDTETEEGTLELLRESVLALMRHPEYWAYAQGTSQRSKTREMAQRMFERLSLEERSRFSSETLVKVGSGNLRQSDAKDGDSTDAGYIVVTLLVGTEDDDPLFGELRSTQDVKNALTTLAAVTPEYLLTVELLWTPQSDGRSLSEDELLMEYPQLISLR